MNKMICPKCKEECEERYREVPNYDDAQFWCLDCLPENMRPSKDMNDALNKEDI